MSTFDILIKQYTCSACGKECDTTARGIKIEKAGVVQLEICVDCVTKKIYELFNIKPEEQKP
jgi:hypothetical protein